MTFQARLVYDFQGVSPGELTVSAGDLVTITDPGVGQGWWMAVAADGREGVIPEAYVERVGAQELGRRESQKSVASGWGDEWDSEEEHRYEDPKDLQEMPGIQYSGVSAVQTSKDPIKPPPRPTSEPKYTYSIGKIGGGWGKSGAVTDYLTGMTDSAATLGSQAVIVAEDPQGGYQWQGKFGPYTCVIGTPKKSSKFGGMKSFIAYQVTPSFSNIQVSRRYKHFDWLHERLLTKFGAAIAIPPLPEKQVSGRFDEDLIEHRRIELQSFTDRICRHPVLAGSEVWRHFVSETEDKKWTQGKRKAESDPLVGTSFLTTLQAPSILGETETVIDDDIATFSKEVTRMESAVKNMHGVANDQANKYRGEQKKSCRDIGRAFLQLGAAMDGRIPCLGKIGTVYEELGTDWENQAVRDWEPIVHTMHDYRGLTGGWQGILGLYNTVKDKGREVQQQGSEKERDAANARVNTYRVGVAAEMGFYKQELKADINSGCQTFLTEQIKFHRLLADRLEALQRECWSEDGESSDPVPPPQPQVQRQIPQFDPLAAWGDSSSVYEEVPH